MVWDKVKHFVFKGPLLHVQILIAVHWKFRSVFVPKEISQWRFLNIHLIYLIYFVFL